MTRGRHANHAYVAIEDDQTGADALTQAISREWADKPAVARRAELTKRINRCLSWRPDLESE